MTKMALRSRTPSNEVEASILRAAEELLDTLGPQALSVRRIATGAGVAPMGVYNHFSSKSGVIEALFCLCFERLSAALETLSAIEDPWAALLEGARRYRALALEHPASYQLMFGHSVPGFEPSEGAKEVAAEAFSSLVRAVERCVGAGRLRDDEPTELAQMLWSGVHGWVSLELGGIGFVDDRDASAARFFEAILRGLQP